MAPLLLPPQLLLQVAVVVLLVVFNVVFLPRIALFVVTAQAFPSCGDAMASTAGRSPRQAAPEASARVCARAKAAVPEPCTAAACRAHHTTVPSVGPIGIRRPAGALHAACCVTCLRVQACSAVAEVVQRQVVVRPDGCYIAGCCCWVCFKGLCGFQAVKLLQQLL